MDAHGVEFVYGGLPGEVVELPAHGDPVPHAVSDAGEHLVDRGLPLIRQILKQTFILW